MKTYITLLRGINVSGQKIIKMADLRQLYQTLSFEQVQSYIQSGNVIFSAPQSNEKDYTQLIKAAIHQHYGFEVSVTLITPSQLEYALSNIPFTDIDYQNDSSKVMLCFLSEDVSTQAIATLKPYLKENEQLAIKGNILYMYCPDGFGRTKLTLAVIERKLQLSGTGRNIKTLNKLLSLAKSSEYN